jgi:hypothetical protein
MTTNIGSYLVVERFDEPDELAAEVCGLLGKGWRPHGTLNVTFIPHDEEPGSKGSLVYTQAMVHTDAEAIDR